MEKTYGMFTVAKGLPLSEEAKSVLTKAEQEEVKIMLENGCLQRQQNIQWNLTMIYFWKTRGIIGLYESSTGGKSTGNETAGCTWDE